MAGDLHQLEDNQCLLIAVEGTYKMVNGQVGFLIDKNRNVYEVDGLSIGLGAYPVSGGVAICSFEDANGNPVPLDEMHDAIIGAGYGYSATAAITGGFSHSFTNEVTTATIGVDTNAGGSLGVSNTFYICKLDDNPTFEEFCEEDQVHEID